MILANLRGKAADSVNAVLAKSRKSLQVESDGRQVNLDYVIIA